MSSHRRSGTGDVPLYEWSGATSPSSLSIVKTKNTQGAGPPLPRIVLERIPEVEP